jgi:vacuolar-type H+-ATPase subunit H
MAVEKGKVLAAIELKFKGKSLTKNFKEKIAEKWAAKVDTDEDIDAFIEDREDVVLEASTEADRRATAATAKAKADAAAAVTGKAETPTDDKPDELPADTPAWAKALIQQNKALADKVDGFERQKQSESIADRLKKDDRTKDVPAGFYKGRTLPTAEDFDKFAEELKGDYTQFATEHKLASFGGDAPAGGSRTAAGAGKVDPDIAAFGKKINEAAIQTQQKN